MKTLRLGPVSDWIDAHLSGFIAFVVVTSCVSLALAGLLIWKAFVHDPKVRRAIVERRRMLADADASLPPSEDFFR